MYKIFFKFSSRYFRFFIPWNFSRINFEIKELKETGKELSRTSTETGTRTVKNGNDNGNGKNFSRFFYYRTKHYHFHLKANLMSWSLFDYRFLITAYLNVKLKAVLIFFWFIWIFNFFEVRIINIIKLN